MSEIPTGFNHFHQRIEAVERRTERLETDLQDLDKRAAVVERDRIYIRERMDGIEAHLTKIDAHMSRLVWLVLGAVVVAVLEFIMRGAYSGPS